MSNPRRDPRAVYSQQQTDQDGHHSGPNPANYPRLSAGSLAEIAVRATRTTSGISERISALKAELATTLMPDNTRRHVKDSIFTAQGSVSHSKKVTSSATKTSWQNFAKQQQLGQKEIIEGRLRLAETS